MSRRRRTFSGAFKAKAALVAIRGDKTTAELASEFEVHGNQVSAWKKQLLEGAPGLFADGRTREANAWEAEDSLSSYFRFYCHRRIHQALGYRTPAEVYFKAA